LALGGIDAPDKEYLIATPHPVASNETNNKREKAKEEKYFFTRQTVIL